MAKAKTRKEREVWHACDELWEANLPLKKMTGAAIAERLQTLNYYRGSNSDIHRFKRSWVAHKGLSYGDLDATNESLPLSDPIILAAKALREEIQLESDAKIKAIQQTADEKNQAVSRELEKLQAQHQEANNRFTELQVNYDSLCQDHERLGKAMLEEQQQRRLAEERANTLDENWV